jgi:hypothetical protein
MDFSTELDERVNSAMTAFEYALGLREPAPPSPEELAAREEAAAAEEQRQRDQAEHQSRLETDPGYYAAQFPVAGRRTLIPGTEAEEAGRQEVERMANATHGSAGYPGAPSRRPSHGARLHPDYPYQ